MPQDLPKIEIADTSSGGDDDRDGRELQWEKRATMLARRRNEKHRSRPSTPVGEMATLALHSSNGSSRAAESPVVSSQAIDADIQEAIRLHEAGELEKSTRLFGQLADPNGANNPLSQVLFGLALRLVPSLSPSSPPLPLRLARRQPSHPFPLWVVPPRETLPRRRVRKGAKMGGGVKCTPGLVMHLSPVSSHGGDPITGWAHRLDDSVNTQAAALSNGLD